MDKHNNIMKYCALLMATLMPMSSLVVSAQTTYLPDVSVSMSKASYWVDKDVDPDELLATPEEIRQINRDIIAAENDRDNPFKVGSGVWDMTTWTRDTYDGEQRNSELVSAAMDDAEYSYNGLKARFKFNEETGQYDKYTSFDEAYENLYKEMIDNCVDKDAGPSMATGYAICTTRTELRCFPSATPLPDDPTDPDYDVQYLSAVGVGEPMIIRGKSGDGKYYQARTSYLSGWVRATDIAFCEDRDQWLSAWNFDDNKALIVYDDKITTEDSNAAPETANRKLTMGVKLRIADRSEWTGLINNRSAYNNYVVWMPVRHEDGSFENKLALIPEHCKVHEGYLPLTTRNLAGVMFNQLGNAYGWGGMLSSQDCSGYIRNVYRCFGLELGRNTNNQAAQPVRKFDLSDMSDEEKAAIIKQLPLGAELIFYGHAMLYLGHEGDKLYVISSVSNLMVNGSKTRVRGNVINTLDIQRADGTSWLHNLHTAAIPYYNVKAKELTGAVMKGLADKSYTGSPLTPVSGLTLNGVTLKENRDYTLIYENNTEIGTALVTAVGKGRYEGIVNGNFKITAPELVTTDIKEATIETIKNQTYTGSPLTPKPKVSLKGVSLVENKDYSLSYSGNNKVGQATMTITGKGNYSGSRKVSFKIIPKGTKISRLAKGKGSIRIKWKKQAEKMPSSRISGYQIQYATNSKFTKDKKTVRVKKYTTTAKEIKKLKRKKKYYVRIRTFKQVGKVTYYSAWSKARPIETK